MKVNIYISYLSKMKKSPGVVLYIQYIYLLDRERIKFRKLMMAYRRRGEGVVCMACIGSKVLRHFLAEDERATS